MWKQFKGIPIVEDLVRVVEHNLNHVGEGQMQTEWNRSFVQMFCDEIEYQLERPFSDDQYVHKDVPLGGVTFEDFKNHVCKDLSKFEPDIIEHLDFRIISGWEVESEVTNKRGDVIGPNGWYIVVAHYCKYNVFRLTGAKENFEKFGGKRSLTQEQSICLRVKKYAFTQKTKELNIKKMFESLDQIDYSRFNGDAEEFPRYYKWNPDEPLKSVQRNLWEIIIFNGNVSELNGSVWYHIKVRNEKGEKWEIWRKYRAFETLYNVLKSVKPLPPFPVKLSLGNKVEQNRQYRRMLFQNIFHEIMRHDELLNSEHVTKFLKQTERDLDPKRK
jgi:hypothetical protein